MLVREVMTEDYPTIDISATLREAVVGMIKGGLDFLIVTEEANPTGLITPKRALIGWIKTNSPIEEISVSGFGSGFPVTVDPETPVLFAISRMRRDGVDVLPVQDGLSIPGVVTNSQISEQVSTLRDEAVHNARMDRWVDETS